MARKFGYPEQPSDVTRIMTTDGTRATFLKDRDGHWAGDWLHQQDGTRHDWHEILRDFGEVVEVSDPGEAIKFLAKYDGKLMRLYDEAPAGELQVHLTTLIEFAEALA